MSREVNYVKMGDHRFHGAYGHLLVTKFNAYVNREPFHEYPPSDRCLTSYNIRHLDSVEKLRDALFIYSYEGQKFANKELEENKRFYNVIFKTGILVGAGAIFGAFADFSPGLLAISAVISLISLFGIINSESLHNDAVKEYKKIADQVNAVYLRWKEKAKPNEETV
ncbi:MAG: hypothetical protein ACPL06_03060 [Candidatus Anstonellales archaeon]